MRIDIIMCILCQISHQNIINPQGISDITVLLDRHLIIFPGVISKFFYIFLFGLHCLFINLVRHFISKNHA